MDWTTKSICLCLAAGMVAGSNAFVYLANRHRTATAPSPGFWRPFYWLPRGAFTAQGWRYHNASAALLSSGTVLLGVSQLLL